MLDRHPEENGTITLQGHKMEYTMRRSKSESAFGIRGSRIFELTIKKDGKVTAEYGRGWSKRIDKEDEVSTLCLNHLLTTYGKERKKERKDKWKSSL